ncbi:MAG: Gfo/Idh/MocA family oxidoreductase, partial [Thermoguttaceae bacterium]|nr:Gfo/Idh/MocA family oxidoreductase [Thermoguttaceae bacterium]
MANRLHIGVIGAGGIARRKTIPGMLKAKNCRLVAVMDTAGVDQLAAQWNVPGYTTEAQLLADPNVQAVYIASPVHCHAAQIRLPASAAKR